MGWCSGTEIFDSIAELLLDEYEQFVDPLVAEDILETLYITLQGKDWDCESDSQYWDHPKVQSIARRRNPEWYEDDEEDY